MAKAGTGLFKKKKRGVGTRSRLPVEARKPKGTKHGKQESRRGPDPGKPSTRANGEREKSRLGRCPGRPSGVSTGGSEPCDVKIRPFPAATAGEESSRKRKKEQKLNLSKARRGFGPGRKSAQKHRTSR